MTQIVKAQSAAMAALGIDDKVEDLLISMTGQFHLIRPLTRVPGVFIFLALDRATANLGMARLQLKNIEAEMSL